MCNVALNYYYDAEDLKDLAVVTYYDLEQAALQFQRRPDCTLTRGRIGGGNGIFGGRAAVATRKDEV
jgi:hypothetical protein